RGIEKLTSATAVRVARPSRLKMRLSQGRDTSNWHRRPSTTTIASAPIDLPQTFAMQPAGHVDISGANQYGPLQAATFDHERAARVEGASIWHGVRSRHRTRDLTQWPCALTQGRNCAHQALAIGMFGAL